MLKEDIKYNDILIFKNGRRKAIDSTELWILREFYDDELNCLKNDDYTIVRILRPCYEEVYNRNEEKTAVELKEEILRLYEKKKNKR